MARFPYYQSNIVELGKLLARARIDEVYRQKLIKNPEKELSVIGLPENVRQLITFKIVDAPDEKVVALPYKLNQRRLECRDPEYLGSIAREFASVN